MLSGLKPTDPKSNKKSNLVHLTKNTMSHHKLILIRSPNFNRDALNLRQRTSPLERGKGTESGRRLSFYVLLYRQKIATLAGPPLRFGLYQVAYLNLLNTAHPPQSTPERVFL